MILFLLGFNIQSQTLVPYRKGSKWGYANHSLKVILKPKYEEVGFFTEV